MPEVDVFLCYRSAGAQTAKLCKKYFEKEGIPGNIWYSALEKKGNFRNDIDELANNAEAIVMFIDNDFTRNFLSDDKEMECITALEVVSICKKLMSDKPANLFTVFLNRQGFSLEEYRIIEKLLEKNGVLKPDVAAKLITQNNQITFSTFTDDEELLAHNIAGKLLSNGFYKKVMKGNFYFGVLPTTTDIVLWEDDLDGIALDNISFNLAADNVIFHKKIEKAGARIPFEGQNNKMISVIGYDSQLTDEVEDKKLIINYKRIEYNLFYKCLKLWDDLNCDKEIYKYDCREKDLFPIPNAMGLSFMVITADNKLMFTRRSNKRGIRPNEYDCSIVEGLKLNSEDDLGTYSIDDSNYLEREICRSFREEVCKPEEIKKIKVYGLVLDKKYGQWNFVGVIHTMLTSIDIERYNPTREDTYESTYIEFVDYLSDGKPSIELLKPYVEKYIINGFWSMGLATLYAALIDIGFTRDEIKEFSKPFSLIK